VDRWEQPEDLLAAESARVAAEERSQRRWARQVTLDGATLGGMVRTLAEARATVAISTTGGHVIRGDACGSGHDFIVIRRKDHEHAVRLAAVVSITSDSNAPADDRDLEGNQFDELLREAHDGTPKAVLLDDGTTVSGPIAWIGQDLLSLQSGSAWVSIPLTRIVGFRAHQVVT
jgi:hypothetical protein